MTNLIDCKMLDSTINNCFNLRGRTGKIIIQNKTIYVITDDNTEVQCYFCDY